jgi:multidrug resistance efflux pump
MQNAIPAKLTLIISLLLLVAGCNQSPVILPTKISSTEIPRQVFTVEDGPVAKSEFVPKDVAELAFSVYGRVRSTDVEIGDVVQKGDVLVQLETALLNADVSHAENAVAAAQAELKLLESQRAKPEARNIATARIGMAEADLISARYLLTQSTLEASFDGTIVDVQLMPGETVSPGRAVITLADMETMQVETLDLSERDISRIYVGQPTKIYVEALNIQVDGVVDKIASKATIAGEDRVYQVVIKLASQPQGLRWGMSAETRFIVDE